MPKDVRGTTAESLIAPLHEAALMGGCRFREKETDGVRTISFSLRNLAITQQNGSVSFSGDYDIRAFLKLYRETADDTVRELLFAAAMPCCYCIDDKCTTLLMAEHRTIEWQGKTKKLCSLYRHRLDISVTPEDLPACRSIVEMMLEHTHPYMHRDLAPIPNEVSYALTEKDTFYVLGFTHKHTPLSASDEEFVAETIRARGEVLRGMGGTDARYVGAICNFVDGSSYDFIFGVPLSERPAVLPEGMACRKVHGGRWAVYNSSAGDYPSIWQHFTEHFYDLEHKGYDDSRVPFEFYSEDGHFSDVHIPVDAEAPRDNGQVRRIVHTPDMTLVGYRAYAEADHPLYRERPFEEWREVARLFPRAEYVARVSIHAQFGKPLMGFEGVPFDELMAAVEGMELYTLRGGYERRVGFKHFCGGYQAWGEAFGMPVVGPLRVHDMHHPRGFNQYVYHARGGYSEIGIPMRLVGERHFEVVELAHQSIVGKLEAPPHSIVTEGDKRRFYEMPGNLEPGSYWIAFTLARVRTQSGGWGAYYDRPLVEGAAVAPDAPVPEGFGSFTLAGGLYVKTAEDAPNGELGWEGGPLFEAALRETGREHDASRPFLYKQRHFGRQYELYVPVKG